jgi:hypothetical protein
MTLNDAHAILIAWGNGLLQLPDGVSDDDRSRALLQAHVIVKAAAAVALARASIEYAEEDKVSSS